MEFKLNSISKIFCVFWVYLLNNNNQYPTFFIDTIFKLVKNGIEYYFVNNDLFIKNNFDTLKENIFYLKSNNSLDDEYYDAKYLGNYLFVSKHNIGNFSDVLLVKVGDKNKLKTKLKFKEKKLDLFNFDDNELDSNIFTNDYGINTEDNFFNTKIDYKKNRIFVNNKYEIIINIKNGIFNKDNQKYEYLILNDNSYINDKEKFEFYINNFRNKITFKDNQILSDEIIQNNNYTIFTKIIDNISNDTSVFYNDGYLGTLNTSAIKNMIYRNLNFISPLLIILNIIKMLPILKYNYITCIQDKSNNINEIDGIVFTQSDKIIEDYNIHGQNITNIII